MTSLDIAKKLISFESITEEGGDAGSLDWMASFLKNLGFELTIETFSGSGGNPTKNLYAEKTFGAGGLNTCFAGHLDVVTPGKRHEWKYDPFEPTIEDGILYGRGVVDMKGAIASYMAAVKEICEKKNNDFNGKLSFLITCDEEGDAINGTKKMLQFIDKKGIKIDNCIVGEPTNPDHLGQEVKVGRRGSITFNIKINGIQGHIAYPHFAANPISLMGEIIVNLKNYKFDEGNEFFLPTNLEFFAIDLENKTSNVIPQDLSIAFNVRFSSEKTSNDIINEVTKVVQETFESSKFISDKKDKIAKPVVNWRVSGESFLCGETDFAKKVQSSIENITEKKSAFTTTGGTSDARFIKDYCKNMVEFGLINKTAHKVDECCDVQSIIDLKKIYLDLLNSL